MNQLQFLEGTHLLPILAPADIAATATASQYVDLKESQWVSFMVTLGAVTNAAFTVTVEASTAASSNATEASVPFKYRLTSAVATDSLGAITAATSDGATMAAGDDNKVMWIDVDPAALPSNPGADFAWLRLVVTPSSDMTAFIVGASAFLQPTYPGNAINSAT